MRRILLADHHASTRWALVTLLEEESDFELVGEAADAERLFVLCQEKHPDLILLDKDLPGAPIEELIAALHKCAPRPIVIVMSSDPEDARRLLRAGVDAYVSKGDQPDWLIRTLYKHMKRPKSKG